MILNWKQRFASNWILTSDLTFDLILASEWIQTGASKTMFWRDKAMEELCRKRMHVKSHRWMDPYSDGDIFLPFARSLSLSFSGCSLRPFHHFPESFCASPTEIH